MNMQPTVLRTSILALFGLTAASGPVFGGPVDPGAYDLVILTTPTKVTTYGNTRFKFGTDGAWNSSFTFGGKAPNDSSQGMTDTAFNLSDPTPGQGVGSSPNPTFGSSVLGDGFAGVLGITVKPDTSVSVSSFIKDTIIGTAGGRFAQEHNNPSQMSGTVDLSGGSMTLVTTGRRGGIDSNGNCDTLNLCDIAWNDDQIGPVREYATFRTGAAVGDLNTINGAVLTCINDLNADGTTDCSAVLVSGGDVGTAWGPSFQGVDYFEVWSIQLLYKRGVAATDTVKASTGFARQINVIANDFGKTPLSLTAVNAASNGTTALSGGGNITYSPNTGYLGPDSFTYTMTDGFGKSATGTVNVTVVVEVVIADDDDAATAQGKSVVIDVDANDVSNAGSGTTDPTSVVPVSPTANGGTVTDNNDGSVTYTPVIDFAGVDTFTYTIKDPLGNTSAPATVTVTVSPGALTSDGTYTGTTITDTGVPDSAVQVSCIGKCFDFTITGVTPQMQTSVVLPPLDSAIQNSESSRTLKVSRYRKLMGTDWGDFVTSNGDSVASAPKSVRGGCPAPNDQSWKLWNGAAATNSNNNDECIRLIITDGGLNDADGAADGTIRDPSGVGTNTTSKPPTDTVSEFTKNAGGGCSLSSQRPALTSRADIGVLGVFLAGLAFWRRRGRAA